MISVIIPFYKANDTIKNCIRSLQAQDYNDIEIIVVEDGKQDIDREAMVLEFGVNWNTLEQNMGASYARNYGAEFATGDLLLFFDADCMMYPGMLRECVTQLEMNPTIDFVYGNYRFEAEYGTSFPEFDPYLLETSNYICTMSPMRRKVYEAVKFNNELKFFQDWDFFYRATKQGFKGKLIPEFLFTTKKPTEDSISGSQGMTLSQKALMFREMHNIQKDLLVVTTGAPYQALQRAKILGADYLTPLSDSEGRAFLQYEYDWKKTYLVGFYNADPIQITNHIQLLRGEPIIHFIGTDVFDMITTHSIKELEMIAKIFIEKKAKVYANSPRLVDELAKCGISAELLYTPIYNIKQYYSRRLPAKFTVGVYCSDSPNMNGLEGEMTYLPMVLDIAKSMPDINFRFFGSMRKEKVIDNIEMCGKIKPEDMIEFINSCSMNLRFTRHDGYPQLPIQFLLCGRKALVSTPDNMEYADKIGFEDLAGTDYEEEKLCIPSYEKAKDIIIGKIYDIEKRHWDNQMLSRTAHKHYSELMSVEKFVKAING